MDCPALLETWLYTSRTAISGVDPQPIVREIVRASRWRNSRLAITGALIFTGGWFAQYIEGPPEGVALIRRSILVDGRHCDVATLGEGAARERRFADWTLAYADDAIPFDRLIGLARTLKAQAGQRLLMEMINRFAVAAGAQAIQSR